MIGFARLAPGPVSAGAAMSPSVACAIALLAIVGDDAEALDAWLDRCGLGAIGVGRTRLVDAFGVDEAVLARPAPRAVHLMPHGGLACMVGIERALEAAGAQTTVIGAIESALLYPAARTARQALAMALLALAASPLAVDVLAWQGAMEAPAPDDAMDGEAIAPLRHLLAPPTVAVVGAANIGKSTLLNALARRRAAIVADEPGTTRDHVGVSLVLDGLAVRWLDTPGLRTLDPARSQNEAVEAAAQATAKRAVAGVDLIVLAADHDGALPEWSIAGVPERLPMLRVRLRCDRTTDTAQASENNLGDGAISIAIPPEGGAATGLSALALAVREMFVPDAWLKRVSQVPLPLDGLME